MKKVIISDINNNSLFRFDARSLNFIEKYGFPATIGHDSINAETSEKVFFSRGIKGILDLIDVWLIWRLNKDFFKSDDWYYEFLSEEYLIDYEKQKFTFNNMYNWLLERKYFLVDLKEGIDYIKNDIDEAKKSVIEDKERGKEVRYLFAKEMYKGKTINFDDLRVESWNMHTITGRGISPDKISLITTPDGNCDALSIVKYLYSNYTDKNDFRLLNNFINYVHQIESINHQIKH